MDKKKKKVKKISCKHFVDSKLENMQLLCPRRIEQRKMGGKNYFFGLSFIIFVCVDYGSCGMLLTLFLLFCFLYSNS